MEPQRDNDVAQSGKGCNMKLQNGVKVQVHQVQNVGDKVEATVANIAIMTRAQLR